MADAFELALTEIDQRLEVIAGELAALRGEVSRLEQARETLRGLTPAGERVRATDLPPAPLAPARVESARDERRPQVLAMLAKDGPLRPGAITERLGADRVTVRALLNRLRDDGLIAMEGATTSRYCFLTAKGKRSAAAPAKEGL